MSKFYACEDDARKEYEVWVEGYICTGQSSTAQYLGKYKAMNFIQACKEACVEQGLPFEIRDGKPLSWGCEMFDNEVDARKAFG